jgi:hypothetical protein
MREKRAAAILPAAPDHEKLSRALEKTRSCPGGNRGVQGKKSKKSAGLVPLSREEQGSAPDRDKGDPGQGGEERL